MKTATNPNSLSSVDLLSRRHQDALQVLLWSQQQGHFHIESLADMLTSHRQAFAANQALQYIPLLIGSETEIDRLEAELRPVVAKRWNAKHNPDGDMISYEELP